MRPKCLGSWDLGLGVVVTLVLGQGVIWALMRPKCLGPWDLGDLGGHNARPGVTDAGMPAGMRQCRQGRPDPLIHEDTIDLCKVYQYSVQEVGECTG